MKAIIRSMLYQSKVGYFWKKIFLVFAFFSALMLSMDIYLEDEIGTVTNAFAKGERMSTVLLLVLLFVVVASAEICGNDFVDKTINHELLSGHSRAQVYFGRALMAGLVSIAGGALLWLIPTGLFSALGHYGDTLELSGLLLRLILYLFLFYRLSCEALFLVCILKNAFQAMALGAVVLILEMSMGALFPASNPYILTMINGNRLLSFAGWSTYTVHDMKQYYVYDAVPGQPLVTGTIAFSIVIGTVFLLLGYRFFQKDDLR